MGPPVGACSAAPLSTYSLVGPYQAGPHLHFAICQTPLSDVVHHRNGYECCSCPSMCLAAKLCNRAAIVSIFYQIWFLQTSLVYLAIFWQISGDSGGHHLNGYECCSCPLFQIIVEHHQNAASLQCLVSKLRLH